MASVYDSYTHWYQSKDKGNLAYFHSRQFRKEYTACQLIKNRALVRCFVKEELTNVINSTSQTNYRVLSLGCGPGSDLLAVMDVFQTNCQVNNWKLNVEVTGVDLYPWPLYEYRAQRSALVAQGPIRFFPEKFHFNCSMEDFVAYSLDAGASFDLIILTFAEVKRRIGLVGQLLPRMLRDEYSRIFVIDNNIWQVRQLEQFGFCLVNCRARTNALFLSY